MSRARANECNARRVILIAIAVSVFVLAAYVIAEVLFRP